MKRSLRAVLLALMASVIGAWFFVSPAQATTVFSCNDDSVCLYQWTNTNGPIGSAGRWSSSFSNIANHPSQCLNLTDPVALWPNGDHVYDNQGSLIINGIPGGDWGNGYSISFYNGVNCNSSTGVFGGFLLSGYQRFANLSNYSIGYQGLTAYHTIASMRIMFACPPGGC